MSVDRPNGVLFASVGNGALTYINTYTRKRINSDARRNAVRKTMRRNNAVTPVPSDATTSGAGGAGGGGVDDDE